jgi:hypothetical protein
VSENYKNEEMFNQWLGLRKLLNEKDGIHTVKDGIRMS